MLGWGKGWGVSKVPPPSISSPLSNASASRLLSPTLPPLVSPHSLETLSKMPNPL